MKKILFNSTTACALLTAAMFSCAGPNEANNTGLEPAKVVVTETEVATETLANGTEVVVSDTDVVTENVVMTEDRQNMANAGVEYDDMFEDIAETEDYNVMALMRMSPNLSTFVELIELSGLAPSFMVAGPITVFAPTNEAFNEMPKERLAYYIDPNHRTELIELINLHVVPKKFSTLALEDNTYIDRGLDKEDIPVEVEMAGEVKRVGGAVIVKNNIETANGMLHIVNDIVETAETAGADID